MRPEGPIRLLIIDDAALFALALAAELDGGAGIHALCVDGDIAALRQQLVQYHPEVILLDLALRTRDALELLRKLHTYYPVPVLVSAEPTRESAARALRAVESGALGIVRKPQRRDCATLRAFAADLAGKVRMAVAVARPVPPPLPASGHPRSLRAAGLNPAHYLVAIGASTGGTIAIDALLRRVPPDFPATVMVQHMPAGFTRSFAARLSSRSPLSVTEAAEGDTVGPGQAVLARGDTHLTVHPVGGRWSVRYTDRCLVNRHCPSVDVLFDSVAAVAGARAIGILLSGMGADGARGLLAIRQAGGVTLAQDRESCVVFGMPKAAIELRAALHTAAPEDIPAVVLQALRERERDRQRTVTHPSN